ncbi:MAG: redoxin domain-containing protein [Blastocatellia bacterium]
MKRFVTLALTVTFALLAMPNAQTRTNAGATLAIGVAAPEFELKDLSGKSRALKSYRGKPVVITFISARCPISKMYQDRIRAVADDYAKQGVAFLAINANADESIAEVRTHAAQNNLSFTILKDNRNVVADAYAAERTPTVYVVDKDGVLRYQGRIDNSQNVRLVKRNDLRAALDELLAGKAISQPETKAMGCVIKRMSQSQTAKATTAIKMPDPNVSLLKPAAFPNLVKQSAGKVLIVNFWATWCGPCVAEFPEFVKLDQTYRDKGVRFVHISADDSTDLKSKVIPFLKEQKAQSDQFLQDTDDPQEMIDIVFKEWSGALPATFVYDKMGKMVFHQFGIVDRNQMIELIEKTLKQ